MLRWLGHLRRLDDRSLRLFPATLGLAAVSGLLNLMPIQGVGALVDSLAGSSVGQQALGQRWFSVIGHNRPHVILLSVIIVYVASNGVSIAYGYLSSWLGMRIAHNARMEGIKAVHLCSLRESESRPSGDVLATLTGDVESIQRAVSAPLIGLVVGVFELIWALILFLSGDWSLGLGILLVSLPLYYLTRRYNNETERLTRLDRAENGILTGLLQESLWAGAMLRVFDRRGYQYNRVRGACETRLSIWHSQARLVAVYWIAVGGLQALGYALALGLTVRGVLHLRLSPGSVLIAWLCVQRFYGPVLELSRFDNVIRQGLVALERVDQVRNMPQSASILCTKVIPLSPDQRRVRINDVAFAYGEQAVLNGVSFDVPVGQTVAIVGASGEGKSTLARILLGLYSPDTGTIEVESYDQAVDHGLSVAAVFQEPMLISGTVEDNILLGEEPDDKRLHRVISLVDPEMIAGLPDGLKSEVGERGGRLSIGQQQRIALMRALYRDPDVLVADEPTSALGGHAEQRVLAALQAAKERSAVIIFSHRLSTVSIADHAVVLRDGLIREAGPPAELLKRGGEFSWLFTAVC